MRIALLVVASLLAACREGVELEVLADSTTTRVEVFVASRAAAPDSALAALTALGPANPDPDARLIAGRIHPRDLAPDGSIEPAFEAIVDSNHRARLALWADGAQTSVHAMIAVGFDADDTITGAAVLNDVDVADAPLRLIMELAPVAHAVLDGQPSAAQVWGREETGGAGCVGLTTAEGVTQFIVTEADPDCDGFVLDATTAPTGEVECNAVDYQGRGDTTTAMLAAEGGTCRPVVTGCVDGDGATTKPGALCLPDALCDLTCARTGLDACEAEGTFKDAGSFAHITCEVPLVPDANGGYELCTGLTPSTSTLDTLFDGSVSCTQVGFATITTVGATSSFGSFEPRLTLAQEAVSPTPVIADVEVLGAGPGEVAGCSFELTPTTAALASTPVAVRQVARIVTDQGQVLMLPVKVQPSYLCSSDSMIRCTYVRGGNDLSIGDGIEACAR